MFKAEGKLWFAFLCFFFERWLLFFVVVAFYFVLFGIISRYHAVYLSVHLAIFLFFVFVLSYANAVCFMYMFNKLN